MNPPRERLAFHLGASAGPRHGRHLRQPQQLATAGQTPFRVAGHIACFAAKGPHPPNKLWTYWLWQDKRPPASLPPLGIWLVSLQKADTRPTNFGPIGYGKTKGRQSACRRWAYGLFHCKSPTPGQQTLGLLAMARQKAACLPAVAGHIACFTAKGRPVFAGRPFLRALYYSHPSHGTSSSSPSLWPIMIEFRDLVLAL